jgi:hypothetical protein
LALPASTAKYRSSCARSWTTVPFHRIVPSKSIVRLIDSRGQWGRLAADVQIRAAGHHRQRDDEQNQQYQHDVDQRRGVHVDDGTGIVSRTDAHGHEASPCCEDSVRI